MPRIRTIKPQFWSTPEPPSRDARLLYVAMWNWADDEGIGTANPKELAAFAFPYDDDMDSRKVQGLLSEIAVSFQCVFYTVGGRPYYCIQNFLDHQVINRPTPSKLPKPDQAEKWLYQQELSDHGGLTESAVSPHITEVGSRKKEVGTTSGYVGSQRSESNARESNGHPHDRMGRAPMSLTVLAGGADIAPPPPPPPPPDRASRACRLPDEWKPADGVIRSMHEQFPHVDLRAEYDKFCDYWHAKAGKDAVKVDWDATWRNWIRRAAEHAPTANGRLSRADEKGLKWLALGRQQPPTQELTQ